MIFTGKYRDERTIEIYGPDGSLFCVATTDRDVAENDPDCWVAFIPDGSGVPMPPLATLLQDSWPALECWGAKPVPELVIMPLERAVH